MTEIIESYNTQLAIARTEIKNLRQQISSLKHEHLKEIKAIKNVLDGLRCASCGEKASTVVSNQELPYTSQETNTTNGECISFRPIGVIRTSFNTKRCVPRQASVVGNTQGFVEIHATVFNNPDHAVFGLEEFSHMWIMFHFHQTESNSVPAKVAPPRLSGEKRGVFATRSPHRPCPIGLSLVKITKIEGNKIHFLGVDMVNGTPVLDVKPYIPHYDSPVFIDVNDRPPTEGIADGIGVSNVNLDDDGSTDSRETAPIGSTENSPPPLEDIRESFLRGAGDLSPKTPPEAQRQSQGANQGIERGSPDGQEHYTPQAAPIDQTVRIAPWISNPGQAYEVTFTSEALDKLTDLIGNRAPSFKTNIQSLLCEDPRSHYVRTRYPDHEFSCVLEDLSISCIFDAGTSVCTIIAVRNAEEMQN